MKKKSEYLPTIIVPDKLTEDSKPRKRCTRDKQADQERYRKNETPKMVADVNKALASLLRDGRIRRLLFHSDLEILLPKYVLKEIKRAQQRGIV